MKRSKLLLILSFISCTSESNKEELNFNCHNKELCVLNNGTQIIYFELPKNEMAFSKEPPVFNSIKENVIKKYGLDKNDIIGVKYSELNNDVIYFELLIDYYKCDSIMITGQNGGYSVASKKYPICIVGIQKRAKEILSYVLLDSSDLVANRWEEINGDIINIYKRVFLLKPNGELKKGHTMCVTYDVKRDKVWALIDETHTKW